MTWKAGQHSAGLQPVCACVTLIIALLASGAHSRASADDAIRPGINLQPAHSTVIPYVDRKQALSGDPTASPYYLPVEWVRHEESGTPQAVFRLPEGWYGRRVFLVFEEARETFYVWVNESRVGSTAARDAPCEVDVTPVLKPDGENVLRLQGVEDVERAVGRTYFWSTPTFHIHDVQAQAERDPGAGTVALRVHAWCVNIRREKRWGKIEFALVDEEGEDLFPPGEILVFLESRAGKGFAFETTFRPPAGAASATLLLTFRNERSEVLSILPQRIHF